MATQKLGKQSTVNTLKLVSELSEKTALPEGVTLRDEKEMVIWGQFTRARACDGWRDFDLVILAKVVRLESDIRKYQEQLDVSDAIVRNDKGTQIVNPLFSVIDSLQRQQLALIRNMSLSQVNQDPRTLNGQGLEKNRLKLATDVADDLIAR
jgi:hypothetical protein